MSDSVKLRSVKLRFECGVLCSVLSYIALIVFVVSCFLTNTVFKDFVLLAIVSLIAFAIFYFFEIFFFIDAIKTSKEESEKDATNKAIKRAMNKTLD